MAHYVANIMKQPHRPREDGKSAETTLQRRNSVRILVMLLALFLLAVVGHARAIQKGEGDGVENKKQGLTTEEEEKISHTEHTVDVDGKALRYSAVAGEIIVAQEDNEAKGRLFYVAYELKGEEPNTRPITFAFNGGPGAASVWLHLGCMGPRRIALSDGGRQLLPPGRYGDNPYTWLSFTDLVFIDPVGTGFSRSIPDDEATRRKFYGVEQDIESVAEFIRLYLTRNSRWLSPKFLVGESYGTTRAAGLASHLQQRHGIDLNGIVLISPVLDFDTISFRSSNDLPHVLYLPTYAATAWHYHLGSYKNDDTGLEQVLNRAESFSINEYLVLLAKGGTLGREEKEMLAEKLTAITGLSRQIIEKNNFRVTWVDFVRNLPVNGNHLVGRMDSSITGVDPEPASHHPPYDPSLDPLYGPFSAAMNAYVRQELQYESDRVYEFLSSQVNKSWDWQSGMEQEQGFIDLSRRLREVMSINPHLRVFIASGVYDLATPYFAAQYTVDHLSLGKQKKNVSLRKYRAGHMLYTHADALKEFFTDVKVFYEKAVQN